MPHLSKKVLTPKIRTAIEKQTLSLLADTSSAKRRQILNELFTPTEKLVLAKRLALITLITKKVSARKICDDLGISTSTVSRFESAIERKKYVQTCKWVNSNSLESRMEELLTFVIASAFGKRGKSFHKMIKDL